MLGKKHLTLTVQREIELLTYHEMLGAILLKRDGGPEARLVADMLQRFVDHYPDWPAEPSRTLREIIEP